MTAAVLCVVWLLILAAIIESGVANVLYAVRTLRRLGDDAR